MKRLAHGWGIGTETAPAANKKFTGLVVAPQAVLISRGLNKLRNSFPCWALVRWAERPSPATGRFLVGISQIMGSRVTDVFEKKGR